jgi:hypothetical protein
MLVFTAYFMTNKYGSITLHNSIPLMPHSKHHKTCKNLKTISQSWINQFDFIFNNNLSQTSQSINLFPTTTNPTFSTSGAHPRCILAITVAIKSCIYSTCLTQLCCWCWCCGVDCNSFVVSYCKKQCVGVVFVDMHTYFRCILCLRCITVVSLYQNECNILTHTLTIATLIQHINLSNICITHATSLSNHLSTWSKCSDCHLLILRCCICIVVHYTTVVVLCRLRVCLGGSVLYELVCGMGVCVCVCVCVYTPNQSSSIFS